MQSEVGGVASVVRSHQRAGKLGMPQTQGVANLMSSYNSQVDAWVLALRPILIQIKVYDTWGWGFSMSKDAT